MTTYLRWGWQRLGLMPVLGLILALFAATAGAKDQWFSAKTEHFEVFTNARQSEARLLVARLEQFRENFLRIVPGAPFREPRTTVVIFDSEKDFRPYKPLYKGKPKEDLAGVFQGNPDEVVIAMTTERDPGQTIPVIYHEYIHLLMHARGFRLPPWLNEGVAELYQTMEFESERITVGRHNEIHVMQLNRAKLMPLAQLFAVTHGSPDYNEGNRRNLFYAESWAFVHFCLTGKPKGKDMGDGFGRLISSMQLGHPPEQCMQEAYGMSLSEMEDELGAHVRGGRYVLKTYKVTKTDYAERVIFRPATDFERDVALGNLKWRLRQNGDATYQMIQFTEREPGAARPYEVLAAIAMREGERKGAIDYWQMAAARKSDNAFVYEQLAGDSLRQSMSGLSLNFRLPEESATELRGWLDRAIELSPDYAEAWEWLALTEAFSKKMRSSVVNKAVAMRELVGDRPRFLAAISLIALRLDKKDMAGGIADALLARPDVQVTRSRKADMAAGASGLKPLSGGSSWMQRPDYYPDVLYIAKVIQRRLQKEKSPANETRPEPAMIEFLD